MHLGKLRKTGGYMGVFHVYLYGHMIESCNGIFLKRMIER